MARRVKDIDTQIKGLRRYNVVAGFLHLAQALGLTYVLTLLDNQILFPVTIEYPAGPPGVPIPPERVELFDINIGAGVVGFLALSALFHFIISSPMFFGRYKAGLKQNHNYFRWVEYSLSSSVMIWLIAQLNGVSNFAALVAIFGVNASMIFFGALQEKYETPGNGKGLPFIMGSITGIVPWLILAVYIIQPGSSSAAEIPGFVYGIVIAIFIFFNTFAFNQAFQYKKVGPWKNYLFGEKTYITLSLVAKSLLAWQVFSGAIIPAIVS
ncbi:MAG: heliorhodopsin HeR [Aquiluna sp.]|nr:heliorhodopsin HeR [Aquiluna sp.]MCF8545929.1 heliorhodopsin HeR [Aquiluna sp.]